MANTKPNISSIHKKCIVPNCTNTNYKTTKLFFFVPSDSEYQRKKMWLEAVNRLDLLGRKYMFCCEDHFNLEEDMVNYMQFRLMPDSVNVFKIKPGVVPRIFPKKLDLKEDQIDLDQPKSYTEVNLQHQDHTEVYIEQQEISSQKEDENFKNKTRSSFSVHKKCIVSDCTNTNYKNPSKLFFKVPYQREQMWLRAANRIDLIERNDRKIIYCCEDHFNLEEDMVNYMQYRLMPESINVFKIKSGIVPHIFPKINSKRAETSLKQQDNPTVFVKCEPIDYSYNDHEIFAKKYDELLLIGNQVNTENVSNINSEIVMKLESQDVSCVIPQNFSKNLNMNEVEINSEQDSLSEAFAISNQANTKNVSFINPEIEIKPDLQQLNSKEEETYTEQNESHSEVYLQHQDDTKVYVESQEISTEPEDKLVKMVKNKKCIVPNCTNTSHKTPSKLFFWLPQESIRKKMWLEAVNRIDLLEKHQIFCCEDHFNLEEDMVKYMQYRLMPESINVFKIKPGIVPHIFPKQLNSKAAETHSEQHLEQQENNIEVNLQNQDHTEMQIEHQEISIQKEDENFKLANKTHNCPKFYKKCIVPNCPNTNNNSSTKLFFIVPSDSKTQKKQMWLEAVNRIDLLEKIDIYCCEDHFNLEEDMVNYMQFRLKPDSVNVLKIKPDIVPHIFPKKLNTTEDQIYLEQKEISTEVNLHQDHTEVYIEHQEISCQKEDENLKMANEIRNCPSVYKKCIVPNCPNTNNNSPTKLFFIVPSDSKSKKKQMWLRAVNRIDLLEKHHIYCCEDHFNLEEDMVNYMQFRLMPDSVTVLKIKPNVVPHIFPNTSVCTCVLNSKEAETNSERENFTEVLVKSKPSYCSYDHHEIFAEGYNKVLIGNQGKTENVSFINSNIEIKPEPQDVSFFEEINVSAEIEEQNIKTEFPHMEDEMLRDPLDVNSQFEGASIVQQYTPSELDIEENSSQKVGFDLITTLREEVKHSNQEKPQNQLIFPVLCDCVKSSPSNKLHKHMLIHNGNKKPYECNTCKNRFRKKSILYQHKLTCSKEKHTGNKGYDYDVHNRVNMHKSRRGRPKINRKNETGQSTAKKQAFEKKIPIVLREKKT